MNQDRTKSLTFAYASSPAAERLNNGLGCWLVSDDSGLPPITFNESEIGKAYDLFNALPGKPRAGECLTLTKTFEVLLARQTLTELGIDEHTSI